MALEPFVLNLDIDPGVETAPSDGKVHLTHVHQNADYEATITMTVDGNPLNFSTYTLAVMTVRSYATASAETFNLDSDNGEIDLNAADLTFRIPAAKTASLSLPKDLNETPFPLKVNYGHDIRLYKAGGGIDALCYGTLELVVAYTRA